MERQTINLVHPLSNKTGITTVRRCGPIAEITVNFTSKHNVNSYNSIAVMPQDFYAYDTAWSPDILQHDNSAAMFQVAHANKNLQWAQGTMTPETGHWGSIVYFTNAAIAEGVGTIT